MQSRLAWKGSAVLGSVLGLAVGWAALIAPTAPAVAAPAIHKCANRAETLLVAGAPGEALRKYKITIKAISAQGVSCAAAFKFVDLIEKDKSGTAPERYKCKGGHFKVPVGTVPEVCTKSGSRIQFAGPGG